MMISVGCCCLCCGYWRFCPGIHRHALILHVMHLCNQVLLAKGGDSTSQCFSNTSDRSMSPAHLRHQLMFFCGTGLEAVVSLDLPDNQMAVRRASGRRVDPQTGRIYHLEFDPPSAKDVGLNARLKVNPLPFFESWPWIECGCGRTCCTTSFGIHAPLRADACCLNDASALPTLGSTASVKLRHPLDALSTSFCLVN